MRRQPDVMIRRVTRRLLLLVLLVAVPVVSCGAVIDQLDGAFTKTPR